ncbi:MAG: FHA domain-containing protein [Candidatus Xenobia bacterium]
MNCPQCKVANLPDAEFCDTCGLQLRKPKTTELPAPPAPSPPTVRHCPSCKHQVSLDDALCFRCGTVLPWTPQARRRDVTPEPLGATSPAPDGRTQPREQPPLALMLDGREILYAGHEMLFGRHDARTRVTPDVEIHDSAASRRHLSIWWEARDKCYYAQDLESGNGTQLNDVPLQPGVPTALKHGDVLQIGTTCQIRVRIG